MDNMDLQPEDVRVPSGDSSPTQAPPDDSLSQQEHTADLVTPVDPALLTSIPRSENQYNEDYTDYARQVHNSTHGAWPVAEPFEEWACRRSHQERYWFYRAWFHHKTLPWDHEDIEYYNQEPNNIQQTYAKPTFSRSPKPTNDEQPTNQNTGRCCHHARTTGSRRKRTSCPLAAPKSRTKNAMGSGVAKVGLPSSSSTGEALHGETGFAVFGPQNEGHKFRRKRNSSLDT